MPCLYKRLKLQNMWVYNTRFEVSTVVKIKFEVLGCDTM